MKTYRRNHKSPPFPPCFLAFPITVPSFLSFPFLSFHHHTSHYPYHLHFLVSHFLQFWSSSSQKGSLKSVLDSTKEELPLNDCFSSTLVFEYLSSKYPSNLGKLKWAIPFPLVLPPVGPKTYLDPNKTTSCG